MDATTREVLAEFERQRAAFNTLLDSLRAEEWERPTPDNETWTVRDVLAHLAGTDRSMGRLVSGMIEGTYAIDEAKKFALDDYNARQVARRREQAVDELRREMDENRRELLAVVERLEGDAWTADTWQPGYSGAPGRSMPLRERLLAYAAHDEEHGAHIRAAVGR